MSARASAIRLVSHIVEGQDAIDVDDGVLGRVAVEVELLGAAAQGHLAFKLDVWNSVLQDSARDATNQESISRSSNG